MIPQEALEAAANAISECSGMRFDGFWTRVEDLEPEDREYALREAQVALEAAAPFIRAQALEDAADDINAGSCDSNYSPEACETCRAVETLRDSAATERGQG